MTYDCFLFFNELDLLELRLNILDKVVDRFVVVEATKTFTGLDKPLCYLENKDRFRRFEDRIIHVAVRDDGDFRSAWQRENFQRNRIGDGLVGCKDDDTILVSDCDEIPNPKAILENAGRPGIRILNQYMCYYYINCLNVLSPIWDGGTRMMSCRDFRHGLDGVKVKYNDYCVRELNRGTTATKLRLWKHARHVPEGGWHFSFLGGTEAIIAKIKAFSHQEFNTLDMTDAAKIEARIRAGEDIFGRAGCKYETVAIDGAYPDWIVENRDKVSKFVLSGDASASLSDYSAGISPWRRILEGFDIVSHRLKRERQKGTSGK